MTKGENKSEESSDEAEDETIIGEGDSEESEITGIKFTVVKINNVIRKTYPEQVVITILRENEVVNSTEPVLIENKRRHEIPEEMGEIIFKSNYIYEENVYTELASTPFLLAVSIYASPSEKGKKKDKKKDKKPMTSKSAVEENQEDLPKNYYDPELVIGQAALDVMPLILGQAKFQEELILETDHPEEEDAMLAYGDSIQVSVIMETIYPVRVLRTGPEIPQINLLTFTMRAIYNATLPEFVDNCYCVAAMPFLQRYNGENEVLELPRKTTTDIPPDPNYKLLIFEPGVLEYTTSEVGVKKWSTLKQINGRPAYTKERLLDNFLGVKNKLPINLELLEYNEGPRVYWNQIHRVALNKEKESTMLKMLIKYRHWPVEVIVSGTPLMPRANTPQTADKKAASPATPKQKGAKIDLKHYIAFVNLENLLYPGVTTTAATAQLFLYDKTLAMKYWGLEESMMNDWLPVETTKHKPKNTEMYDGRFKSKTKLELKPNIVPIVSNGKPVFLWVDVKVAKPFVELMEFSKIQESIQELLPRRENFDNTDVGFMKSTKENFKLCVENLSGLIAKEYCDYKLLNEKSKEISLCYDEQDFFAHLKRSGAENVIKATLNVPVTRYVTEVIGSAAGTRSENLQEYLTTIYTRLSEDIHSVVSEIEILNRTEMKSPAPDLPLDHLLFMAAEADATNNLTKCKYFMFKRLETDVQNPEFWLDLAVPLLHTRKYKEAMEHVKEALLLDSRNQEALLLLAGLLTITGQTNLAEICYDGLTRMHPRFCEGWIAFHCFYCLIGKTEGAEETQLRAIKCEAYNEKYDQRLVRFPVLNWDYLYYYQEDDFLLRSIIYLLSLNLHELVEICMGEMLALVSKKTPIYHYYLAACHYQQKRYRDSLDHLEALTTTSWRDSSFWILRGHNFYQLKKHKMARSAYEIAIKVCENPVLMKFHLVHLRMGYYLLKEKNPKQAYEQFKVTVGNFPTASGWCGLGIACYKLEIYNDAELCFTESNILDPHVPITWAYLALINALKRDVDMFDQCTVQSFKKGLRHHSLVTKLWHSWKILKGDVGINQIKDVKERILRTILMKKNIKKLQHAKKKHVVTKSKMSVTTKNQSVT